ncbi:MAG: hypothetical protein VB137_13035 [Burkholderia sp.]
MDHGSQYRSDDFRAQLKFCGITPSYAFVAEPQTNGVAEGLNRTMKEHGYHEGRRLSTGVCSTTLKKFVLPPSRLRTDTITNVVSKNWASRSPSKPVRQRSCHLPPDRKIVSKQPDLVHCRQLQKLPSLRPRNSWKCCMPSSIGL